MMNKEPMVDLKKQLQDILSHILVSFLCMAIVYLIFHSTELALICLLVGIFIDLDHLIDHSLYFGLKFSWTDFFGGLYLKSGKVYLFLHSWELIVPLWIWGIYFKQETLTLAITIGFITHLLIDQYNRKEPLMYFLTFRVLNGFKLEKIMPKLFKDIADRVDA